MSTPLPKTQDTSFDPANTRGCINIIKKSLSNYCPLTDLRASTFEGLVTYCKARQKINKRSISVKRNAIRESTGHELQIGLSNYQFPACCDCKMFEELKQGFLPERLQHIKIINLVKNK